MIYLFDYFDIFRLLMDLVFNQKKTTIQSKNLLKLHHHLIGKYLVQHLIKNHNLETVLLPRQSRNQVEFFFYFTHKTIILLFFFFYYFFDVVYCIRKMGGCFFFYHIKAFFCLVRYVSGFPIF